MSPDLAAWVEPTHVVMFLFGVVVGGALDYFLHPLVRVYARLRRGHDRRR